MSLRKSGDSYVYDDRKLEGWFNYQAVNLAGNLPKIKEYRPHFQPRLWRVDDEIIPKWAQELFSRMGIAWITERPGEEANYIVFLTYDMRKFHETYLCT